MLHPRALRCVEADRVIAGQRRVDGDVLCRPKDE